MIISQYVILFFVFSFFGWIFECTYCAANTKQWENRGFLMGPLIPIYGFGATAAVFVFGYLPAVSESNLELWQVFLISAAGSAVLEYATSYILEVIFHMVWWDYSEMPLNLNGRICLPATALFGLAGTAIVHWVIPFLQGLHMEGHPLINEILALTAMFYVGADLALTVNNLMELMERLENIEQEFNSRMENAMEVIGSMPAELQIRREEAQARILSSQQGMREKVQDYAESMNRRKKYIMHSVKHVSIRRPMPSAVHLKEIIQRMEEKRPSIKKDI